ncbi:V-type ATPase subunit [Candidatus Aerophobetes bacterium]|nr:V-type ATPase subunit [Candidatus Aerophobetes bacterium]
MSYLEISTKDTRYAYPTGRIRGLEKYLLKDADLARIKEGKDLEESFQNLSHFYPYSESIKVCDGADDFERGLDEEWRRTYLEVRSFAPEPELVELFWLEQDFHNMKVLFKLHAQQKLPQEIDKVKNISTSGTLNPALLLNAITKGDVSLLPPFLKEIISEVMDMMEREITAREIALFLDRVYFQKLLSDTAKLKDYFLKELTGIIVDSVNIKSLLRIKLWGRDREQEYKLLEASIIDGGKIKKDTISKFAGESLDSLLELAKGTMYQRIFQRALEEWKERHSLFSLDRLLEDTLFSFTYKGFYITFGREPLVNYIMLKKSEIKKLRSILRSKKANFSEAQIENIGL